MHGAVSKGLGERVHTARDSSLIMCRTRRTILPTASSACNTTIDSHTTPETVMMSRLNRYSKLFGKARVTYPMALLLAAVCPTLSHLREGLQHQDAFVV